MPQQRTYPILITKRTRENGRRTVRTVAAAWTWELALKGLAELEKRGDETAVYMCVDKNRVKKPERSEDFRYITDVLYSSE